MLKSYMTRRSICSHLPHTFLTPSSHLPHTFLTPSSHLPRPQHDRLRWICHKSPAHFQLRPYLGPVPGHLDVKVKQQSHKDHLDFVGRKEAPWARMAPVSPPEVRLVGCDKLVACVVARCASLSQLVVPEAVESRAVRIASRVGVGGEGGDRE
jgi:hypothetical protein